MKVKAFANRLSRDLKEKSLSELTADVYQEIGDAINASLQKLHAHAPSHSKITTGGLRLAAPQALSISVVNGSNVIAGYTFSPDQIYCTIRIEGETIDHQITGADTLLHAYSGPSGTVGAVVYSDACAFDNSIESVLSDPVILETGTVLQHDPGRSADTAWRRQIPISRPDSYWIEPNSLNQNPPKAAVMRFNTLPDRTYRLECRLMMAPLRIAFTDLLAADQDLPVRGDHVESYLLPVARGELTSSSLWRDKDSITRVRADAEQALAAYAEFTPKYLTTPRNRVGTARGF